MCGRTRLSASAKQLELAFGVHKLPALAPLYNIAPTDLIAIVRTPGELELVQFGLMPPFVTGPTAQFINARAETVATKTAFRDAFKLRRCLVIASGFYEWRAIKEGKKTRKQPYLIQLKSHDPFAMAGIWERWMNRETGEMIDSCAIITIAARQPVAELHDRQPLILQPGAHSSWIDPNNTNPGELLDAVCTDEIEILAVNPAMNNARNKAEADCALFPSGTDDA